MSEMGEQETTLTYEGKKSLLTSVILNIIHRFNSDFSSRTVDINYFRSPNFRFPALQMKIKSTNFFEEMIDFNMSLAECDYDVSKRIKNLAYAFNPDQCRERVAEAVSFDLGK